MFGTIRKHQTWLWVFIIVAMILGLVIYFSPTAGTGGGRPAEGNFGSIDGVKISRNDYMAAAREAYIAHALRPDAQANFDEQRRTYERLFLLQKVKKHNIHIDDESVARAANNLLLQVGRGRPVALDVFVQQVLGSRATEQDFVRYLRHQLAIEQLISVVGLGGDLVSPQEVKSLYVRENQEVSAQVVLYLGTNYQTSVTSPTPEQLQEFYTNQMVMYRLPERVQLSYVAFAASNHLAEAEKDMAALTNLNEIVEQAYQQRGTNFYSDAKTPEEAKQKIREEIRGNQALGMAAKKAEAFMDALFAKDPVSLTNLQALAQAGGLTVKTTAPFDEQTGPEELENGATFGKLAFQLTPDEPFADRPLIGENVIYVAALSGRIPSEVPAYETIKDRVAADYKRMKANESARRAGTGFATTLGEGLKSGKNFAELTAAAQVKPVSVPAVSASTETVSQLEGRINLMQFKRVVLATEPGHASEFVPTADGGFIVFVEKRLPIDEAKMNADLPEFTRMVRQARREEAINAWFQREATKSLRDTPLMQSQPSLVPAEGRS